MFNISRQFENKLLNIFFESLSSFKLEKNNTHKKKTLIKSFNCFNLT